MLADLIRSTFFGGGPGQVLFELTLIGTVSYVLTSILQATNHGSIAGYVRTLTGVVCIGMVAYRVFAVLELIVSAGGGR